jgi:tRNA A-37 threonylcarbamoyl transferase component Bud32
MMGKLVVSFTPKVRLPRRAGMKHHRDRLASIWFDASLEPTVTRLLDLVRESPVILVPVLGADAVAAAACASRGFRLYPTVLSTTLFHDPASDCFLKIIHPRPRTLRERARSLITDRARQIYSLSEWLGQHGVKVPRVRAFGTMREGGQPFYAVDRLQGRSLYDILIREQRELSSGLAQKVIDEVARLHSIGYWLGDAHLSHIFVHDEDVNGFIDIDSMRRNRPFRSSNLARDLAGLNHPMLSVGRGDKESLLRRYARRMDLKDGRAFQRMVEEFSEARWRSERNRTRSTRGDSGP